MSLVRKVGLALLAFEGLFSIVGPFAAQRLSLAVYPDYVRAPPSLWVHPTDLEARSALLRVAGRMRTKVERLELIHAEAHATLVALQPIDLRALVYFERSDAFRSARLTYSEGGDRRIEVVAPLKPLWLPLGTDTNGRDLLARMMLAVRISMVVGALGSSVALGVGVIYGMIAGYAGGKADLVMMRLVDALYALPFIFFVILLTAFFGRSFLLIFLAIGVVEWLDMARLARGQTLSLKNRQFVLAARSLGSAPTIVLARHIAPNIANVALAYLTILTPRIILIESFLSFLGLGVREPLTSLGVLVADGTRHLQDAPWLLAAPAGFLMMLLYGFTFAGARDIE